MFNRIVQCFEPNVNINSLSLSEYIYLINKFELFLIFLFRIKQRTYAQMENDLFFEKVFDMTIELKAISIIFPEKGVYKE
jgi:hypothetical protein